MAVTYIASSTGTTTAALPTGTTTGDIVVAFAYATSTTIPTLPASWTNITSSATTMATRVQYRVYDGVWAMPTFTTAATTHAITLRGQAGAPVGVTSCTGTSASNVTWPTVTLQDASGNSALLRGVAHTRPDSVIAAPTGHTSRQAAGTQPGYMTCTKNATTDGLTATSTVSRNTTWTQSQVEIKGFPAGTAALSATSTLGATATTITAAITQAAYRWYDEGTESGSVALAAQNTAVVGDITNGDATGTLRIRLQSTNTATVPSTDDWQLQWEKNASGTWTPVSSLGGLFDTSTAVTTLNAMNTVSQGRAQTFMGNGSKLKRVGFWISKTGTPGTLTAVLYTHSGTFGTTGVPALAGSLENSNTLTAADIPTGPGWVYFDFSGTTTMANGTPYAITVGLESTVAGSQYGVGYDGTTLAHPGNYVSTEDGVNWTPNASRDTAFEVYAMPGTTAVTYDSPNLTNGQATTNRLTGGTGTFVPGKVSEDSLMDDLGWSANNYTELVYALQIMAADLTAGDTLRFRVLRNGATTSLTYAVTPTITLIKSASAAVPRNIHTSNPATLRSFTR